MEIMVNPDFDPDLVIDLEVVADPTIIRGTSALTFLNMTDFTEMIQKRPLDRLLGDFRELAMLSDTKFSLVRSVVRRRLRTLPQDERESLRLTIRDSFEGERQLLDRLTAMFAVD